VSYYYFPVHLTFLEMPLAVINNLSNVQARLITAVTEIKTILYKRTNRFIIRCSH
jgi:hypothetical protein